ncbi:type VII toxin-antitoxin system HepT family RNase toxin [Caldisalinibacter kiritimatiensis]|uniref:DUF86 domain-containing protein n=1 Tax=Caldisalinibacter kiritimatiensis TaxID=1304284 RepID=R1CCR9_9FIRM|nr:DUF86 domain-containing protein [Caldisalinibacter kiritimatiensis]EOD00085.1 protein of unknown function DUF86 [Caldisalinibacter kiritimatiensis]
MVKIEVIKERLNQLMISIDKIKKYQALSLEEFLKDDIAQDIVEYNLFISINMIIDIAMHIVTDENMGYPNTFGEAFKILYKENYIAKDELEIYKNMIGFRNILSHEYIRINKKLVYEAMQNRLKDLEKFILFVNDNFMI